MDATARNVAGGSKSACVRKLLLGGLLLLSSYVFAQAPAASSGLAPALSETQLDTLVAPIALYPDDLVAIILPGSTYPLEIVQADRFLEKRKKDKALPLNEAWHESIKSLLNYPEVVKQMSSDLDWTSELGEAVVANQGAVLEAVQRFRRQVQAAGHLKSDDKQTVIVEKEVIKVVQANPEVIYVPQYVPSTMVVAGGYPSYGYMPAPYPVYYYPYPPGAAFATGLIWGAAITAAWSGGHYAAHYGGGNNNININRNTTINSGNVNRPANAPAQGSAWKSDKKPGQVSGAAPRSSTNARVGDSGAGGGRGGNAPASRPSAGTSERGAGANRGGDAFGGYGSGSSARADSSRGAASRESMSGGSRGQSFQGASARSGGGGGGRAGGGGGRGGRR
jgi:hypothetical protein